MNKRKLQKRHQKVNNRNEWQRKKSVLTGVWNWLTELPNTEFGFKLSKQQFWDSIRLDVSGNEGNRYFLIFWVFDHNACRYCNKCLQQCHVKNKQEKKRAYSERILLLHFYTYGVWIDGSMGRECHICHSRLAISEKMGLPQSISSNWIRKNVSFWLLKSSLLCLQGSRTVCRKTAQFGIGVDISHTIAKIKLN